MIYELDDDLKIEARYLNIEYDNMYSRIKSIYSDFSISKGLDFNKILELDRIHTILRNREYQFSFEFNFGSMERDFLNVYFITGYGKIEFLSASVFKNEDSIRRIMQAMKDLIECESVILNI